MLFALQLQSVTTMVTTCYHVQILGICSRKRALQVTVGRMCVKRLPEIFTLGCADFNESRPFMMPRSGISEVLTQGRSAHFDWR